MSELIDREALLDECLNHYEVGNIEQNCTMDWICKTVRNFPAAPRWVRCEERLPDIAEKVLVYNRGQIFTAWRTSFSEPIGKWDSYDFQTDDITHWMPLPEPPKEDA